MAANAAYPEHPKGTPISGDIILFWDFLNGVLKQVPIDVLIVAPPSNSFDWLSDHPYALGEVVVEAGEWYRSLQADNNNVRPGVTVGWEDWWEIISKSYSFQFWKQGVYTDTNTIVFYKMANRVNLYQLSYDEVRPFDSLDFPTELAAGKWLILGSVESIETNVTNDPIDLDALTLPDVHFNPSDSIDADVNALVTMPEGGRASFYIETTVAALKMTFTTTIKSSSGNFYAPDQQLNLPYIGFYRLQFTRQGGITWLDVFEYQ